MDSEGGNVSSGRQSTASSNVNSAAGDSAAPIPAESTASANATRNSNNRSQRHRNRRGINRNAIRNREGIFLHYLFITLSVRYASFFKPTVRRMIEFFTLIKAVSMLMLLIYVHITFVRETGNCLSHVEDIWPRNGVLKVQVEANTSLPPYQYFFGRANSESWATSFEATPYQAVFKYSIKLGRNGMPHLAKTYPTTSYDRLQRAKKILGVGVPEQCPMFDLTSFTKQASRDMLLKRFSEIAAEIQFLDPGKQEDIPKWLLIDPSVSDTVAEAKMLQMHEVSGFNVGPQPIRDYYAIEYSTEFGYLKLSAIKRHKLGIPMLVVTLDPTNATCFGSGMKRWMLETFFGYDDIVMSSIKRLAEKNNKQGGYLRNLVTGEHFKFITLWSSHASYLVAFAVMLVFTLLVTMLLRYSYHQIFVFMVDLLNILDADGSAVFPAGPMLTIILALVGTEQIMTEFFHDSTLAFYVILSIWIADQFDSICMHTFISRRHWVRFFFLYHFAFYAYHYRFNGQLSELALFTSWLFIQHSMFYFLHHYEIPAIQRQIRLRRVLLQNSNPSSPPPPTAPGGDHNPEDPSAPGAQNETDTSQNLNSGTTNNTFTSQSEQQGAANDSLNAEGTDDLAIIGLSGSLPDSLMPQEAVNSPLSDDLPGSIQEANVFTSISDDAVKTSVTEELWEEISPIIPSEELEESDVVPTAFGFSKYCSFLMLLLFFCVSLILMFSLSILLLNQGRLSPRVAANGIGRVADIML